MKFNKKYIFVSVIVLIGIIGFINPLAQLMARDDAAGRIAYVDVQAVFNVHPDKKVAETQLNQEAQAMQSELENKAKDLSKDKQQEMLKEYQAKLSQKEQELIQQILVKIDQAIKHVAEEKQVRLVLDKRNVIYGGYDMTQDVVDYIKANTETSNETSNDTQGANSNK